MAADKAYLGPVRISIPATVANDLGSLQKSIANLVGELGCRPCFSGADCYFEQFQTFYLNKRGDPQPQPNDALFLDPQPRAASPVKVFVPDKIGFNLDVVQESVARVVDQLACPKCHSGMPVAWIREKLFVVDEAFNVKTPRM
jgi:hypothetical protein